MMKVQNVIILMLMFISCKTISNQDKNKILIHELILLCEESNCISKAYFKTHYVVNNNQIFEIDYVYDSISGNMIDSKERKQVKLLTLCSNDRQETEEVLIKNGYVTGTYKAEMYAKNIGYRTTKTIVYKKGDISGEFKVTNIKDSVLYKTTFKNGNGYWKDFYYENNTIREEGRVKNNFKEGIWNYYNISGRIDSTKTHTINELKDVRFPYALLKSE